MPGRRLENFREKMRDEGSRVEKLSIPALNTVMAYLEAEALELAIDGIEADQDALLDAERRGAYRFVSRLLGQIEGVVEEKSRELEPDEAQEGESNE